MDRRDRAAIGVVGIASLVILLVFPIIAHSQRARQRGAGPDAVQEAQVPWIVPVEWPE